MAATLTRNCDPDKYGYSVYGTFTIFVTKWRVLWKCCYFCVKRCLSLHANNREKDVLALSEGATDALDETSVPAKAQNFVNITKSKKKFVKLTLQCGQQFLVC